MRKVRTLVVAVATVASIGGFSASAMAANVYTVDGSGTTGGTPAKPKAANMSINFTISSDPPGNLPDVIQKYAISIEGGRINKAMMDKVPQCKQSAPSAAQSADQCPSASIIGKGNLAAAVGDIGAPIIPANTCKLPFNLYNISGHRLGLFISASQTQCLVPVKQWVIVNVKQVGRTVTTTFSVPANLQQPSPGLFSPVTDTTFSLK